MNKRVISGMILAAVALCVGVMSSTPAQADENWQLSMQVYTFNRFSFYEAVEKSRAMGIRYIEAYPGQRLSDKHGDARFHHDMSPELREEVKQMLRDQGVKLINYGVVGLPNNEQQSRRVFDFARDMGIETIVSEPPENAIGLIDRLCQEYEISVALHNHPEPSFYWNPDTVLRLVEGRSKWIGACADTGHWTRSGVDPVEAVRKLEGRIISFHFKDLNEFGNRRAHDVPWGQGKSKAREVLEEMARQGFKGSFSVEYEHNWLNSMPEIIQCVAFFDQTAYELGVNKQQRIFNGQDLDAWTTNTGSGKKNLWTVGRAQLSSENPRLLEKVDGLGEMINLAVKNGDSQDIYSKAKFGDCRIEVDVMVPRGSNSGVYVMGEYEVQVLDSYGRTEMNSGDMGAIYGGHAPPVNASKRPGEWQHFVIDWRAPRFDENGNKTRNAMFVKVELNGQVLHRNLEMPGPTPGGVTGREAPTGPLMFQGNHGPVAYRNIIVKPLEK